MNRHPYGGYDSAPPPRRRSASPPHRGYRGGGRGGRGGGRGGGGGGGYSAQPPLPPPPPPQSYNNSYDDSYGGGGGAPYGDYSTMTAAATSAAPYGGAGPRDPYYSAPSGSGGGPSEYSGYDPYMGNGAGAGSDYGSGYDAPGRGGSDVGGGRGARGGGPSSFARGGGAGPRPPRHRDDKVHDSIIEERVSRERPCRTLFIRNIKYESNSERIRDKFEEHGEIKTFFDLIKNRGMVFVTYFDLRAAEKARERLQGMEIAGRPIDVHFSLPREHELSQRCDRDKNQGTLLVTLVGSQSRQSIDDNELRRKLQQFGDVKAIKPVFGGGMMRPDQRFVEMFDSRACAHAHDRLRNQSLQDGLMELDFEWDIPDQPLPPGPVPIPVDTRSPPRHDGPRGPPYRGPPSPRRNDWDDRRGYRDYPPSPRSRGPPARDYQDDYRRPPPPPPGGGSSFPPITPIGDRSSAPYAAARGSEFPRDRFDRDRRDDRPPYGDRDRRDEWRGPPPPRRDSPGPGPRGPPPMRGGPDEYGRERNDYGRPPPGPSYPAYDNGPAPPGPSAPVDDRLEQAKKVQQLLAALKPETAAASAAAPAPPMPPPPQTTYYGGAPPPPAAPYGGYSQPGYPPAPTYMGGPPPPASAPVAPEGVQNLLALLSQNQNTR